MTGAPSAMNIGVTIIKIMCCTTCTLNSTVSYAPSPERVAMAAVPRPPAKKATLRRTGQRSPRRRSLTRPAAYSTAGIARPTTSHQSRLHSVSNRSAVSGGGWSSGVACIGTSTTANGVDTDSG